MDKKDFELSRRQLLKWGLMSGAGALAGSSVLRSMDAFGQLTPLTDCNTKEAFPISPFILTPFAEDNSLPIPLTMRPGWQRPDGTLLPATDPEAWTVRKSPLGLTVSPPSPLLSRQDSYGFLPAGHDVMPDGTPLPEHAGTHQVWPVPLAENPTVDGRVIGGNFNRLINWPAAGVEPVPFHIRLKLGTHSFTTSRVRAVGKKGKRLKVKDRAALVAAGVALDANDETTLPASVIYGFNGAFPGALINVEYGKPVVVRFENDLDINPPVGSPPGTPALDRQDFGAPDFAFLTHLHNGHTAPESDGQPHYMQINDGGYIPQDWVDNLYLNYPAGGDPAEIQSSLWFHDHRMHHTGANVYKGMVGLMPVYDTGIPADGGGIVPGTGLDTGNETDPAPNLGLPGVKVPNGDGSFNVKYEIPLALYDCALDDGLTQHGDQHTEPAACGATHPEWWGKTFFKHFPNHGFVGDVFTVNGTAYPVLHVEPRRYRFRFLGASVSRIYQLCLMTSAAGPQARPGTQGQWQIPDGVVAMNPTQVASMGGLLPNALDRESFEIWPATRGDFIVDFTGKTDQTIYLTNVLEMPNGRMPKFNDPRKPLNGLKYKVPLMKIVVDTPLAGPDNSANIVAGTPLRPMPVIPTGAALDALVAAAPEFLLKRSGKLGEEESWLIGQIGVDPKTPPSPFVPDRPLWTVTRDVPEVWTVTNGGGGWVHPMHMHMEEHTTLFRNGLPNPDPRRLDDTGKQDVANLDPGESVTFYRNFRTFSGRYVAHCHNLAHEDHNMMFGWTIVEP